MKNKEEVTVKWKLSEKPTAASVESLLKAGIITKEEARKIVLEESVVTQSDIEAVKSEIKLLRDLVLEISKQQPVFIPQIIRIIERQVPEWRPGWVHPYVTWCSAINTSGSISQPSFGTSGTNLIA